MNTNDSQILTINFIVDAIQFFNDSHDLPYYIHYNGQTVTLNDLKEIAKITLNKEFSFFSDDHQTCVHFYAEAIG